jgi:hypothetical protein
MNREAQKREHELEVFLSFISRTLLPIEKNSIRNGDPHLKQPDILCTKEGISIGFELSRLTDRDIARMVNRPIDGKAFVKN